MDMVQQKNGPDCAAVLRAMLHATISSETESKVRHLAVTAVIADPGMDVMHELCLPMSSLSELRFQNSCLLVQLGMLLHRLVMQSQTVRQASFKQVWLHNQLD